MGYYNKPSILNGMGVQNGTGGLYGQNGAKNKKQQSGTNGGYSVVIGGGNNVYTGPSSPSSPVTPSGVQNGNVNGNAIGNTVTIEGGAGNLSAGVGTGVVTGTGNSGTTYGENHATEKVDGQASKSEVSTTPSVEVTPSKTEAPIVETPPSTEEGVPTTPSEEKNETGTHTDTSTPVAPPQEDQGTQYGDSSQSNTDSNATNNSTEVPPPMTYGEYLAILEEQKNKAVENAEVERQGAINDAQVSYQQNKATYGANAEKLASMGLTGSGYSDYIDSQAYAQQRAEVQGANKAYGAAVEKAEQGFTEQKLNIADQFRTEADVDAQEHKSNFNTILDIAGSSNLSDDMISYYASIYNLSEEEVGLIKNATNTYNSESHKANYLSVLDLASNSELSEEMINAFKDNYNLSDEEVESIKKATADYTTKVGEGKAESDEQNHVANFNALMKLASTSYLDEKELNYYASVYNLSPEEIEILKSATDEYQADTHTAGYLGVLEIAMSSELSEEMIDELAKQYGLTSEETDSVRKATNTFTNKSSASARAEFLASLGDNVGAIKAAVEAGTIGKEEGEKQIKNIQSTNYADYAVELTGDAPNFDAMERAAEDGNISQEQLTKLKKEYSRIVDVSESAFGSDNGYITKYEATQLMTEARELLDSGWIDKTVYDALSKTYETCYSITTKSYAIDDVDTSELEDDGNNFVVRDYSQAGDGLRVQSGGRVEDAHIIDIAADAAENKVFLYRDKLYVRRGEAVYLIESRDTTSEGYDKLLELLKKE